LALLAALLGGETAVQVLAPWPMKIVVDHALGGGAPGAAMHPALRAVVEVLPGGDSPLGLVMWCVAATLAICLGAAAVALAQASVGITLGARMSYRLAADLLAHLQRLSLRFHARRSVGDSMRRVTSDCGCVATIVRDSLLPAAAAVVTLAVMFAIMVRMNPPLAVMAAAVSPAIALLIRRYAGAINDRAYEYAQAEGDVYALAERGLSSMPVVQAFGLEPAMDARMRAAYDRVLSTHLACTAAQFRLKVLTGLAIAAGTACVLWVGSVQVLEGRLTVGGLLVFLAYLASLYAPLDTIVQSSATAREALGDARRVREVLAEADMVRDEPGAVPLAQTGGAVSVGFDAVTFGYEEGRPVLHGVTFEAAAGSILAVVGPTGAGKSTLAALVARLYDPWEGRVLLDGHDSRRLTVGSVRAAVAVVPQETYLFPASIAENIAYGLPGAGRGQVEAAARAADAHEFITRLPEGYDTVIGQRGGTLSGGQRQRIAIARALLVGAPVLLLDEPTASLDAESERALVGALAGLRGRHTVIIIAHRLSTIRAADSVLVLDRGRVVEQGPHDRLAGAGGLYASLLAAFAGAHRPDRPPSPPPEPAP
jgi:ATP-binding cassette subfamily B protein/subfamily B ATP-binding cassette protein MsbA